MRARSPLHAVAAAALAVAACQGSTLSQRADASSDQSQQSDMRLHEFRSEVFGNTRFLRILLPDGYSDPENRSRRYPVLYLNDGQNLFDSTTAVLNRMEWRVDETVRALTAAAEIEPLIVVGIDNAGRRGRFREYFPWVDEYLQPPEPEPRGERYPEFLVDEVLPFVEQNYRTRADAGGRGIGGSSAGGLAALFAVIRRPGVFSRLLVESPSLYVADAQVLLEADTTRSWPDRVYLGMGTNETGASSCDPTAEADDELVRDVRRLQRIILESVVDTGRVMLLVEPCAVHNESAWAGRLPTALRFLFSL